MRVLLLLLVASAAVAQPPSSGIGLSDSARVSLLTMLPGEEAYSLWGHNALRIVDPAAGIDRTYNYGTFTFEQPNFVLRFLSGRLDYMLATAPYDTVVAEYWSQGRPIIEQMLDLEPETVRAVYDLLETNALPENRSYRYDFLRDNCGTRLLDVLQGALAETDRPGVDLVLPDSSATFRDMVRPYASGHPLVDLGIMLGLGLPMDDVASPSEAAFLPDALSAALEGATVGGQPLVAQRDTVFWIEGAGQTDNAFPWPTALAWLVFATGVTATMMRPRGRTSRAGRWADAALMAVCGGVGLILLLMWIATDHYVTEANVELLWLWPTHLIAAVAFTKSGFNALWRRYTWAAAGVTGVVLLGWFFWPEPMHAALLPIGLLLIFRLVWRGRESGHSA